MSDSQLPLSKVSKLEEERDFLLRSLDDLDREYASGELTDREFGTLRGDYTRRVAAVVRSLTETEPGEVPVAISARFWRWFAVLVSVGVLSGFALAQFSG